MCDIGSFLLFSSIAWHKINKTKCLKLGVVSPKMDDIFPAMTEWMDVCVKQCITI